MATWVVYGVAAVAHALVFIYGFGSPWWRSLLGITIFAKWLSVMLVFDFIIARRAFGEFPGYGLLALVTYGFMFLAFSAVVVEVVVERRHPADEVTHRKAAMSTPITPSTVPEVWYKAQRVLRTIVQALVVLVPIVNGVAAAIIDYLNTQTDVEVPGWAFLWLNAALVGSALVMGLVARIMAVPGVNALLTKIGLGSVPASAIVAPQVVAIDPKVADNGAAATSQHTGGSGTLDGGGF